jgi:uncharacterized protein (UPF0332 family)
MLDDLERQGYIKRLPVDRKKVLASLQLAKRDIAVAKGMLDENHDWAFSIAYNAILQAVRALMFSHGYRPSGDYQHIAVVRFAELFLPTEDVIAFDRMRRKRHITLYDSAGTVSEQEAQNAVERAERLVHELEKMLAH